MFKGKKKYSQLRMHICCSYKRTFFHLTIKLSIYFVRWKLLKNNRCCRRLVFKKYLKSTRSLTVNQSIKDVI